MRCHAGVTARGSRWARGRVTAAARDACGSEMRRSGPVPPDGERGALSLMIVVLFVGLIAMAGIVVDGGAQLTAYENAEALAQEAARAGATSVDASSAYRSGAFVVDAQQAQAAVSAYLATAGNRDYRVSLNGVSFI